METDKHISYYTVCIYGMGALTSCYAASWYKIYAVLFSTVINLKGYTTIWEKTLIFHLPSS